MRLHLIRHGKAGSRSEWSEPDELRPLDGEGRRQAEHLAKTLGDQPVGQVVSSPAIRCTQTVEPLAARLGLAVETEAALLEGASVDGAVALLDELARAGEAAACSHGDLVPKVLRHLSAHGLDIGEPRRAAKGSVWVLDHDGTRFTTGRYFPPT